MASQDIPSEPFRLSGASIHALNSALDNGVLRIDGRDCRADEIAHDPELALRALDRIAARTPQPFSPALRALFHNCFIEAMRFDPARTGAVEYRWGALLRSGSLTEDGSPDRPGALAHFRRSAAAGDTQGLVALGRCYLNGRVVGIDYVAANRCFNKAALLSNDPEALMYLGDLYRAGKGVDEDPFMAFNLYRKSAFSDPGLADTEPALFARAISRLADCYREGIGCKADPWEALTRYQRAEAAFYQAIRQGHEECRSELREAIAAQDDLRAQLLEELDEQD